MTGCCPEVLALRLLKLFLVLVVAAATPARAGLFEDASVAHAKGDYATALRLLGSLAEQGNASAQNDLGEMYGNGEGVAQDYSTAATWYQKAADQGEVSAQFHLGLMYGRGQGVPKSLAEAHKWFDVAAAQSNADAIKSRDLAASKMTPVQIAEAYFWAWMRAYLP